MQHTLVDCSPLRGANLVFQSFFARVSEGLFSIANQIASLLIKPFLSAFEVQQLEPRREKVKFLKKIFNTSFGSLNGAAEKRNGTVHSAPSHDV